VQPVPTPPSTKLDETSKINAGGSNQNEMLFNLGNQINSILQNIDWTIFSSLSRIHVYS